MIYQFIAILILAIFYAFLFCKNSNAKKGNPLKQIRWELGINLKMYC